MSKTIRVAIDGPAAAGKSTVAKEVAKKLSFMYIDTGAMYRALTLKAIQSKISVEDEEALEHILQQTRIEFAQHQDGQHVYLDGKDVTLEIRNTAVTQKVSTVAKYEKVRKEMVKRQRQLAGDHSVVMDGRDIGTYVLPDAEVKVFLMASSHERAKRRHRENLKKGFPSCLKTLTEEIKQRDLSDSQRKVAPLIKARDAIEIDTTKMKVNEVVEQILNLVLKAGAK